MPSTLTKPETSETLPLALARCKVTPVSLTMPKDMGYAERVQVGRQLRTTKEATNWLVGDWLNGNEHDIGEKYAQAIHDAGFKESDIPWLQKCNWVSANVSACKRLQEEAARNGEWELDWCHYHEVASVAKERQAFWLNLAVEKKLSVRELRASIKEGKVVRIRDIEANAFVERAAMHPERCASVLMLWERNVLDAGKLDLKREDLRNFLREEVVDSIKATVAKIEARLMQAEGLTLATKGGRVGDIVGEYRQWRDLEMHGNREEMEEWDIERVKAFWGETQVVFHDANKAAIILAREQAKAKAEKGT